MGVEIQIEARNFNYNRHYSLQALTVNETHIYEILLSENMDLLKHTSILSVDEQTRAQKFFKQKDRDRFTISRVALRNILSHYLQIPNTELVFIKDVFGKYHLQHSINANTHFSITHSGNIILIAVSKNKVGIDVEISDTTIDYKSIMQENYSAKEREFVENSEHSANAFLTIWTKKEAILKAIGVGLVNNLSDICTIQHTSTFVLEYETMGIDKIFVSSTPTESGYCAALATTNLASKVANYNYALAFS